MRNVPLVLLGIAASASIASADPIAVSSTADDAPSHGYVSGGLLGGFNHGDLVAAGTVEVGMRVSSFAAVHGVLVGGDTARFLQQVSGRIVQARAGADLFTCNPDDKVCLFVGADVGVQHTHDSGPGCADFEQCYMSEHVDVHDTSAIGVGRVGIDAGSKRVRVRLEADVVSAHGGTDGADAITSIAFRF